MRQNRYATFYLANVINNYSVFGGDQFGLILGGIWFDTSQLLDFILIITMFVYLPFLYFIKFILFSNYK